MNRFKSFAITLLIWSAAITANPVKGWSAPIGQVDQITLSGPTYQGDQWTLDLVSPVFSSVTYTVTVADVSGCNICNATSNWVAAINSDPIIGGILTALVLPSLNHFTLTANTPGIPFSASVSVFEASQSDFNETEPLAVSITTIVEAVPEPIPEPGTFAILGLGLAVIGAARRRKSVF